MGIWIEMRLNNNNNKKFQGKREENEDSIREEWVSIREVRVDGEVRIFKNSF